ncbi:MAG: type II secretion system protein M [Pseudomonadota bacterium]|nr:type II secretion system protein M [Pseudomonadota bacterium]
MGSYWRSLSARERSIVKLGVVAVACILFYLLAWEPKIRELQQLRTEVPQLRATLAWMTQEIRQAGPLLKRGRQPAGDGGPLLTVIEQAAQQVGVRGAIQRMQPAEGGQVKVWFQDVVADEWLRWLDALARQGVRVVSTTVTRSTEGMVSARVTVSR